MESFITNTQNPSATSQFLSQVPVKTQMVPTVVYIQPPAISGNHHSLQFANLTVPTTTNILNVNSNGTTLNTNEIQSNNGSSVIFTTGAINGSTIKGPQLILQNQLSNPPKLLTMIQPTASINMIKEQNDLPITVNENGTASQTIVMTPIQKVITDSLPAVTVTPNTLLQPNNFAFMPLISTTTSTNFKIVNNQVINMDTAPTPITVPNAIENHHIPSAETVDSPSRSEKEYELSIVEDTNLEANSKENTKVEPINTTNNNISESQGTVDETNGKMETRNQRRRKSQFTYRKDFDEDEVEEILSSPDVVEKVPDNDQKSSEEIPVKELAENDCNLLDIDLKETTSILKCVVDDVRKLLQWEEGFGSLPNTDLKFIINEFNMVEYVTTDEYLKMVDERRLLLAKAKELSKTLSIIRDHDIVKCAECGCCGTSSNLIVGKFCSIDCKEAHAKTKGSSAHSNVRKKRKRLDTTASAGDKVAKTEIKENDEQPEFDLDLISSNENSQDKCVYPWASGKKYFSWSKYLDHIKAKAAPSKLFVDPFPYNRNGFRVGMKLEGIDPQHPSHFCVLSVAVVCGYRLRLHFDGYSDSYDFWRNADSIDIFPAGWCEKHNHVLQPPSGYTVESFNWINYLKATKAVAAPKHLFANRAVNSICPNGFRVGMKLEAVDKKNKSLICVATVKDIVDNRILVRFDSWDDIYDYWAYPNSPYIHPVGWCDLYGHSLTPPNDYPEPEKFTWTKFLKETNSVAAPLRAFKVRIPRGFKRDMRFECVDKRVPQLVRVATVDDVNEHQIRIRFDGWPDKYSYWIDDDNENIHPAGWCQKTGHPLETPLTPSDVYDFLECSVVGCRGVGHTEGAKYSTHSDINVCPYAEDNLDVERHVPDRLSTQGKYHVEEIIPISRGPPKETLKPKPRIGRPPKYLQVMTNNRQCDKLDDAKSDISESKPDSVPQTKRRTKRNFKRRPKIELDHPIKMEVLSSPSPSPDKNLLRASSPTPTSILRFIEESKVEPSTKVSWLKHSNFLCRFIETAVGDPLKWSKENVEQYVSSIPGCSQIASIFTTHEIDGEAFLLLSLKDFIDILGIKVGPAVKLYNSVLLLRKQI